MFNQYKGSKVEVRLPSWLAAKERIESRTIEAVVIEETARGIKVKGWASTRPTRCCHRCGRDITNPISQLVGYGPECSAKLGIPRDFSEADIPAIRARLAEITAVELWLPLDRVTVEIIEAAAPVPEAPAAPAAPAKAPAAAQQAARPAGPAAAAPAQQARQDAADHRPVVKAVVKGQNIQIIAPFSMKDVCKGIMSARWDNNAKAWTYPATAAVAENVRRAFEKAGARVEGDGAFGNLVRVQAEVIAGAAFKSADELLPVPCTKFAAWKHQLRGYWFAEKMPAAMLAMDMGTGKSKVTVDLIVNRNHKRTLIVCPFSVMAGVWPGEFRKHAGRQVQVFTFEGTQPLAKRTKKADEFLRLCEAQKQQAVVVINFESIWRSPVDEWAIEAGFDLVVLDESHRVKAPGGKAAMYLARLGKAVPFRLCLTGTPMPHSPLDIYAQYRFLDPGVFGTSFNLFKNKFALLGGYGGHEVMGFTNQAELNRLFFSLAYKCDKAEVLDLPPFQHIERYCKLSPAAARIYESLEDEFVAKIADGSVTASNALTKLLRLQQLTSGYVRMDAEEGEAEGQYNAIDTSKQELLADIMEDMDVREPLVVFARFTHDLNAIRLVAEEQGRKYAELSGRLNELKLWQSGGADVIGVQIRSGGVGVDLTRARYAVYYSLGFSLGDFDQSLARINRPGQTRPMVYYHLISKGTVDMKVYKALRERRDVVQTILDMKPGDSVDVDEAAIARQAEETETKLRIEARQVIEARGA